MQKVTFFCAVTLRMPSAGGYVGLEPTKNRTPSWLLEAEELGAPFNGKPWNFVAPRSIYGL